MIEKGSKAPVFELPDGAGNSVALKDFAGQHVLLYFYPKDDTSGCTKQACAFRDLYDEFCSLNCNVLGVSPDDAKSHTKFAGKYDLPFSLLSDLDHSVMEQYGAWGEKSMYGKKYTGVIRSAVWIDPDGVIVEHWPRITRAADHPRKVLVAMSGVLE